jgi:hypothetical protein
MIPRDVNDCDRRLGRQVLMWCAPFQLTMIAETAGLAVMMVFAVAGTRLGCSWMRRPPLDSVSSRGGMELLLTLRCYHFLQNGIQLTRDLPLRIVRLELPQIRNVADVIALARFLRVMPV